MLKYAISLHVLVYVAFGFFKWLKSQNTSLYSQLQSIAG